MQIVPTFEYLSIDEGFTNGDFITFTVNGSVFNFINGDFEEELYESYNETEFYEDVERGSYSRVSIKKLGSS